MFDALDVFLEARTAETDAGVQEMRTDSPIVTDAAQDSSAVAPSASHRFATSFAKSNLEREKRVGPALDQFGIAAGRKEYRLLQGLNSRTYGTAAVAESEPTTMRSGLRKSRTAEPSRKNSGA